VQVTKTENSKTNITLAVSADATDLAPIKRHVLTHFKDVKVPGFRAGKAPVEMIEKHVNQQLFLDEFMEHALNDLFRRAITENGVRPIGQPDVKLKKFVPFTEMEFEATIDIFGDIILPDYKKIKLAKPKVELTAKDVNDVLDSLQKRLAERRAKEGIAKDGDEVTIDFAGKDADGKPVAGTEGKDYPLVLGSKTFIPGFEENLLGVKAGDHKEFSVTFPKDYGVSALQNKKVTFAVDVKLVSDVIEPKLDDEFAAKVGPFKTLAELKDDIKKQVRAEKQLQADQAYENNLIKTIADKSKVEIPEVLVQNQIADMEAQEKQNLTYRGQTWQEHLEQEGITEAEHRERQRPEATERVKAGLVLSEVAEREAVEVTPEEVEIRLQILKGQYQDPQMQAELDKPENHRDIEMRLLTEKTVDKLVNYASK